MYEKNFISIIITIIVIISIIIIAITMNERLEILPSHMCESMYACGVGIIIIIVVAE